MLNTVVPPLLLFITVAGSPCSSVHPIPEIVWVKFSLDDQIRKEEKEVKTNRWCGCCPFPSPLKDLERKKSSISLKRYTQDFSTRSLSLWFLQTSLPHQWKGRVLSGRRMEDIISPGKPIGGIYMHNKQNGTAYPVVYRWDQMMKKKKWLRHFRFHNNGNTLV